MDFVSRVFFFSFLFGFVFRMGIRIHKLAECGSIFDPYPQHLLPVVEVSREITDGGGDHQLDGATVMADMRRHVNRLKQKLGTSSMHANSCLPLDLFGKIKIPVHSIFLGWFC